MFVMCILRYILRITRFQMEYLTERGGLEAFISGLLAVYAIDAQSDNGIFPKLRSCELSLTDAVGNIMTAIDNDKKYKKYKKQLMEVIDKYSVSVPMLREYHTTGAPDIYSYSDENYMATLSMAIGNMFNRLMGLLKINDDSCKGPNELLYSFAECYL
jgi:hypothetical protein